MLASGKWLVLPAVVRCATHSRPGRNREEARVSPNYLFCRLTIGFLRKIENLEAAVNLHMAYFNFCWRPGTMKVTPAQAAGIAGHCWTFDELLAG